MSTHGNDDGPFKTTDDNFGNIRDKSRVVKRSIVVGHHKTSVSLEDVFWNEYRAIADQRKVHLSQLISEIDFERKHPSLFSAIRLLVLERYRRRQ